MTSILHLHLSHGPACGRQLSGHRPERAQAQDTMKLAASYEKFREALLYHELSTAPRAGQPKACRWCARAVGLLPPVQRRSRVLSEDEVLDGLNDELEEGDEG